MRYTTINNSSVRIRWSSCRLIAGYQNTTAAYDRVTVIPYNTLNDDVFVTFDVIIHANNSITFDWSHIVDPTTLSSSANWLVGVRRLPYFAEPQIDVISTAMGGRLSDRQYLRAWGNRTMLTYTDDSYGPDVIPPSTGAYIPRDLVVSGTAWNFCAIYRMYNTYTYTRCNMYSL
jgi:hypothetical protein